MVGKLIFGFGILLSVILSNTNLIECGTVKKIQYSPCSSNINACNLFINLNSACIRCEICLLIANQIDQILALLHKQMFSNDLIESQVKSAVTFICDNAFENYGLEEFNGERVIFDYLPTANPIFSNVDGQWNSHLKQRCRELTEGLGTAKLYETWKVWRYDRHGGGKPMKLETALCRAENAFLRDCRGISSVGRRHLVSHKNERLVRQIIHLIQYEEMFS